MKNRKILNARYLKEGKIFIQINLTSQDWITRLSC